ncbi:nucleosidase [Corynebacterium sp. L4756]|uniref:nucleosidase n=1 Tax=unclassified Corynebacterium TaxID=2624378 RepID=UPI00374CD9DF
MSEHTVDKYNVGQLVSGESLAGRTLFVAAVHGEADRLPDNVPLLITGIGTLPAAISLSTVLARAQAQNAMPARVVNVGTAGALRDGLLGVYEVDRVVKHDFFLEDHSGIGQYLLPDAIELKTSGRLPTAGLATGDQFVGDGQTRARLAKESSLCDMEGYAVAATCGLFGVPVTLLKQISDSADEVAEESWAQAVPQGARQLYTALGELGLLED